MTGTDYPPEVPQQGARQPNWATLYAQAEARIAELEAALRFYADPKNHEWREGLHEDGSRFVKASSLVDHDRGNIARAVLAQSPQEEPEPHMHDGSCGFDRTYCYCDDPGLCSCGQPQHRANPEEER